MRRELGISENALVVLCIANLRPEKNVQLLVRAFEEYLNSARTTRATHLVVVGDGECRTALEELKSRLLNSHSIHFIGRRSDAWRYLAIAEVFALPSRFEGLPVAVMEALALDVPTIGTKVGGMAEVVETGVNGLLVPSEDVTALAKALEDVLTNEGLRHHLTEGCRAAAGRFTAKRAAESHADIYRELLDRGSVRHAG
jgi:glycosyltransferase involved in cell wall biosynthesis